MAALKIVFARDNFIAGHITVVAGSHWRADDPLVKSFPNMFTDDLSFGISSSGPPVEAAAPVEKATAAPGERRTRTRGH